MLATGSKVRGGVEESDTLCTEVNPRERQVWNVYAPVLKLLLKMCFETETVCAIGVARKETLVVFPVVFEPTWRKGGSKDKSLSEDKVEGASPETGGRGINDAMSPRGMEADVPLSKRT